MRYFCLVCILAAVFINLHVSLWSEEVPYTAFQSIVEINGSAEREAALRERLSGLGSLNGRLLFLEEAARHEVLKDLSDRIRLELLLLGGRTEEAEELLVSLGEIESELGVRLAVNHGKIPLSESGEDSAVPGLNRRSLKVLAESSSGSPEYYAARRGMIFSAAFLLSPYFTAESESGQDHSLSEKTALPDSATSADGEMISIQVGAFSREQNASAHISYLSERGIGAEILEQKRQDGTTVYKTIIPGIPQSSAQRELIRLKEKGIEGFILY
jgi:hypothetical protein